MKKVVFSLGMFVVSVFAFTTSVSAEEYTVNKGDTLWSISQKYNVSIEQLMDWNGLTSDLIFPNDQLTVSSQPAELSNTREAQSNDTTYTVQSGDTLYAISQKHSITVDQLMGWNNLTSTIIHPGEQLAVSGQVAPAAGQTNKTSSSSDSRSQESNVVKEFTAEATAYTASCAGCSGITATGINLHNNPDRKVIAVDPDVIPLGSKVWVEGYGVAVAGDTGGAIQGNRVDVFIPNRQDALNFGRRTVTVRVLN